MKDQNMELIRSNRKTLSLQIRSDGTLLVRAPMRMPMREIEKILEEKSGWIAAHREQVQQTREAGEQAPLRMEDIQALGQQALQVIPERVKWYAQRMGVGYGRITIRNQTSRWGSCSSEGNLNFNCLLMLTPAPVLDYVIVHELAHRKQMNHSAAFWAEVEAVLPDYRERLRWLKQNGGALLSRMRCGAEE